MTSYPAFRRKIPRALVVIFFGSYIAPSEPQLYLDEGQKLRSCMQSVQFSKESFTRPPNRNDKPRLVEILALRQGFLTLSAFEAFPEP